MSNVFNFSAGPAMMPPEVLQQAQAELLNWQNQGTSVMEVSHRGKYFIELAEQSVKDFRQLFNIPSNYKILFLQGGARGQFAAIPMNLIGEKGKALYLNSGHWSATAAKEARNFAEIDEINILDQNGELKINRLDFSDIAEQYDYVHYCPNETISGVEIFEEPKVGNAVLVADMSSNILSRKIDVNKFGLIYAGAQKNIGPGGVVVVIARKSFLAGRNKALPSMLNYEVHMDNNSLYNTPPAFAVYVVGKVAKWLKAQGGLEVMARRNEEKAKIVYDVIDAYPDFYHGYAEKESRSLMNVTFGLPTKELEEKFATEAKTLGMDGLKGHRSVGGLRASIYNAMPKAGCEKLAEFMEEFYINNK